MLLGGRGADDHRQQPFFFYDLAFLVASKCRLLSGRESGVSIHIHEEDAS